MRPGAFLDRDGVVNVDTGFPSRPSQIVWTDGVFEAVRALNDAGCAVVVVTNQSGVARGLFSERDIVDLHQWMSARLLAGGAIVSGWYYCPYCATGTVPAYVCGDHPDRKPNPGMLLRAAADLSIDLPRSLLIGDRESDLAAAKAAGVCGHLFTGGDLAAFTKAILALRGHGEAAQATAAQR